MATRSNTRKRRNGLAAFRAVETEVAAALGAGRTLVDIYEEKQVRLAMSYAQFARYAQPIRKALREGGAAPRWVAAPTPSAIPCPSPAGAPRKTPLRGRPEDAIPTLNLDRLATEVLTKKKQLL
jgi:hypothetical protein